MEKIDLKEKRKAILDLIRARGPCLPSTIASAIKLPLLLTSALVSELRAEHQLESSSLKVGGSPLYYLKGQEAQLEAWIEHLPKKEQEAFALLKRCLVVNSEQLEPALRVALANLHDFAVPFKVKFENKEKTFWRFHSLSKEEAAAQIAKLLKAEKKKEEKVEEKKEEQPKKKELKKGASLGKAKEWLNCNNFRLVEELKDSLIASTEVAGAQINFLVMVKDKARIGEADLSLAYQQGLLKKMPVLLLFSGKLTKAAQAMLKDIGSYLLVKELKS